MSDRNEDHSCALKDIDDMRKYTEAYQYLNNEDKIHAAFYWVQCNYGLHVM
jgi:hypothetical protein